MKPVFLFLAVVAAMALPAAHAFACGGGPINTPDAVAFHVVTDINTGDLNFVESNFDSNLSATLPAPALQQAWQSFSSQLGTLRTQGESSMQLVGAQTVVTVPVQSENGQGQVRMVVNNADMTIDGLSFLPATS
jgi:hypothetical protein